MAAIYIFSSVTECRLLTSSPVRDGGLIQGLQRAELDRTMIDSRQVSETSDSISRSDGSAVTSAVGNEQIGSI